MGDVTVWTVSEKENAALSNGQQSSGTMRNTREQGSLLEVSRNKIPFSVLLSHELNKKTGLLNRQDDRDLYWNISIKTKSEQMYHETVSSGE